MSPIAPGKRAPLWQQRLKAGQLLEAARREREFPILVETARECLQDVYDMRALHELMEQVQAGSVRLVEAQTSVPSPFAAPHGILRFRAARFARNHVRELALGRIGWRDG